MADRSGWISTRLGGLGPTAANPVVDEGTPQVARMYDYYLGGKDHFASDRKAAEEVIRVAPSALAFARSNRHFMHLAVEHLAREQGVDQFLDIGTGIPTRPNLHQIAQYHRPDAHVLYADNDPIVLTYAEALLTSAPEGRVDYIEADVRRPEELLQHPCLTGENPVLDFARPVALFAVALFHFVLDEDQPVELLRKLVEPLASGSYLVLSHGTGDFAEAADGAADAYRRRQLPMRLRSRTEIGELLAAVGLEELPPGVQSTNRWWPSRPAHLAPIPLRTDAEAGGYGVLARKP